MVITFGVPVTKVNGVTGSYYTPGDSIGLGSFRTAVLWGSYFDATWHLMTTDSYDFTQGM